MVQEHIKIFEKYRPDLMGLAYRMTGSVTDAEDMVQDTWLRWQGIESSGVENPRAFLHKIITRLCLDRAKSARIRKETYVGPWLPEPIQDLSMVANDITPDKEVELADELSFALLLVLERLSPPERAAFILHDVFDYSFKEISETLDRSPDACRKLASRARSSINDKRPAPNVDESIFQNFVMKFQTTIQTGDVSGIADLLAEDAVMYSDGGGKKSAALNPIFGRDKILRFTVGIVTKFGKPASVDVIKVNGCPALKMIEEDGTVVTLSIDCDASGIVQTVYIQRNSDKLQGVQ
ncbi:MAG: sigma-70 family RNA polymerase sigma factor [Methyloligellaceae bacterium]